MGDVGLAMDWVLRGAISSASTGGRRPSTDGIFSDEDDSEEMSDVEWSGWMRDLERQAQTRQHLNLSQKRQKVVSCGLPSSPISSSPDSDGHFHFPFTSTFTSPPKSPNPADRWASKQDHRHAFAHRPRSPLSAEDMSELSLMPSLYSGRIATTITSTVSVGTDSAKARRRSSTITAGMGSRLLRKKDKGKEKDSEGTSMKSGESTKSSFRPKPKLSLLSDSADVESSGQTSSVTSVQNDQHTRRTSILRHVRSGSNLQKKREEHEPASPTMEEDPNGGRVRRRLGLVKGVSVQAERIARGLDSALDFVDGRVGFGAV